METFSASLALFVRNSPVTGKFPVQRPVMWKFDVFFDLHLNKQLSKQSWGWWFEMPLCSLWHHCNDCNSNSMEKQFCRNAIFYYHIQFLHMLPNQSCHDIHQRLQFTKIWMRIKFIFHQTASMIENILVKIGLWWRILEKCMNLASDAQDLYVN